MPHPAWVQVQNITLAAIAGQVLQQRGTAIGYGCGRGVRVAPNLHVSGNRASNAVDEVMNAPSTPSLKATHLEQHHAHEVPPLLLLLWQPLCVKSTCLMAMCIKNAGRALPVQACRHDLRPRLATACEGCQRAPDLGTKQQHFVLGQIRHSWQKKAEAAVAWRLHWGFHLWEEVAHLRLQ